MIRSIKILFLSSTISILCYLPSFAQSEHLDGHFHPDSLELVAISGIVIIDSTMMSPMYYLDENGNEAADYHLNFGPPWYEPDSSLAKRPADGDEVTILGGLHVSHEDSFRTVVVYEINGLFWRKPYDALWNNIRHSN